MFGTGLPLLNGVGSDVITSPGQVSGKNPYNRSEHSTGSSLTGMLEDVLDLSNGLEANRQHERDALYKPATGRGETGVSDFNSIQEQLKQVGEQVDSLQNLLLARSPGPEQRRVLGRGLQETGATLEKIGLALERAQAFVSAAEGGEATYSDASRQFVALVKGFRQVVQEVEKILADEDRIPQPLMRMIKNLTSESLKPEARRHVSEIA